ncbi:hypothetical protein SAY86_002117 [Trapa natans]|uniref:gibberellin 3beta-dioxygenase n=1 Tax=Trapa natans TaxID=22666 RepID=A0AAN7LCR0_TRANT|nr:hypothetical protein SAY86_002117 [Trapa natans]
MPSRISEAVDLHQNKYLDLNSMKELPESYAWTQLEHESSSSISSRKKESVPIIDLRHPDAVALVGRACITWGVFQVINHGIPKGLDQRIEGQVNSLFSLPMQRKLRAARSPDGISGYGVARISCFFQKLMWSEGFTIVGSPLEHARQLWPHGYTEFCDIIGEYDKEMKRLAGRIMWLILGSLGISEKEIRWVGSNRDFAEACAALQLNSYPPCPDPTRAMGLAAHTDSTIFTILHQSNTSGLEVLRGSSGWVAVPPVPRALVINVGDLLQILSNGLYQSVLHRALVNGKHHRLSVAYLYGPPKGAQISPLPKLISPACPPIYRSVTWAEYLQEKAKHFNKALSSVRICASIKGLQDAHDKIIQVDPRMNDIDGPFETKVILP